MNRTEARAAAMKLIFEWEMGGDGGEDTLSGILEIEPGEAEYDYMRQMVDGTIENVRALDEQIARYIHHGWTLERLSRVDLAILRLGAYEVGLGVIPAGVAVQSAVELANAYSDEKSGPFVNGVLGNVMRAAKEK